MLSFFFQPVAGRTFKLRLNIFYPTHLNISGKFTHFMGRRNKINVPSSQGGIVRYFDEYKSKLEISPQAVLVACFALALLIIFARAFF